MSGVINAVSKNRQSESALRAMTARALGGPIGDFSAEELAGGLCNAVYRVRADGRTLVLKIAPREGVRMMRHERDILRTESDMLRLFGEKLHIPIPEWVAYDASGELCAEPYLAMGFVAGQPLLTLDPRPDERAVGEIKRGVGEICRQISSLPAPAFGIPAMPETYCASNAEFMRTLMSLLLEDAADRKIAIPATSPSELLARVERVRDVLNEARTPVHVHTDTWDGNLMVEGGRLSGLVDFAAILYGDPLLNHDFHDFSDEPRPEFAAGFGKTSFTPAERLRISLYKLWQRLGMIVERGYRGYEDPNQYAWVHGTFADELARFDTLCRNM